MLFLDGFIKYSNQNIFITHFLKIYSATTLIFILIDTYVTGVPVKPGRYTLLFYPFLMKFCRDFYQKNIHQKQSI